MSPVRSYVVSRRLSALEACCMEFSSEPEPGFLANSSRFVVFGTSAVSMFPLPNFLPRRPRNGYSSRI